MKLKLPAVVLAALSVLAVAACGGDDNKSSDTNTGAATTTTEGGAAAAETLDVSLTDFKIDPPNPTIDKAGVVELKVKNDGGTVHNIEVEGPNGEKELASNLNPGQTGTLSVDLSKAGTYEWYCPVGNHRELGMEGEVTVGGGGGQTTTGQTETQTTETQTTDTTETDSGGSGSNSGSGRGY